MNYFLTPTLIYLALFSSFLNINATPSSKQRAQKAQPSSEKSAPPTTKKTLPIGINSFKKIIRGGYLYVDKTRGVHHLYRGEKQHFYFLTRPQGFGKSTLLSTIKYYFGNNMSLFDGLYAGGRKRWKEMKPKPVIMLDFASIPSRTSDKEFKEFFAAELDSITEKLKHKVIKSTSPILKTQHLINKLYGEKKQKVVVLIDNYDAPIRVSTNHQKALYNQLKDFYQVLHKLEDKIEFLFITGLCNFYKKDLFATLNLTDLSLEQKSKNLIGFTEEELAKNFTDYVDSFVQSDKTPKATVLKRLKSFYGGYDFTLQGSKAEYVSNPKSILKAFADGEYSSFFEKSDLYGLLSNVENDIKTKNLITKITSNQVCKTDTISLELYPEASTSQVLQITPVLCQLGIIAAKQLRSEPPLYSLTCANTQARYILKDKEILKLFTPELNTAIDQNFFAIKQAIANHDPKLLVETINKIIYSIPSKIRVAREAYFQSIIHIILMGLNLAPNSEYTSGEGVADTVVYTDEMDYIFEYKLNKKSIDGFKQIYERRYANGFAHRNKPITCIAMSFYWKGEDSTGKINSPLRISYRVGYIDTNGHCIDPHESITYKSIDDFKKYCLNNPKNQKTPTKPPKTFAEAHKNALQKTDADIEAELMGWKK